MDLGTTKMIARTEGGIGWMIFNQPEKHNAVSYEMWLAVPKIMAAFEADPQVPRPTPEPADGQLPPRQPELPQRHHHKHA